MNIPFFPDYILVYFLRSSVRYEPVDIPLRLVLNETQANPAFFAPILYRQKG